MGNLAFGSPITRGAVTKIEAILESPAGWWWLPQDDLKHHRFSHLNWWRRTHMKRRLIACPCGKIWNLRAETNDRACSVARVRRPRRCDRACGVVHARRSHRCDGVY